LASQHPDHPFLAVHMGGGGTSYREALNYLGANFARRLVKAGRRLLGRHP
jgi:hypothetical protein